jgi:hypothetical protein
MACLFKDDQRKRLNISNSKKVSSPSKCLIREIAKKLFTNLIKNVLTVAALFQNVFPIF